MRKRKQRTVSQVKTNNDPVRPVITVELWLSILSFIIASVAIYFSWQANQIANTENELISQQITDQLVISEVSQYGGNVLSKITPETLDGGVALYPDGENYAYCSHKIRLSNNGGSSASILNFSVRASYLEETAFLDGYGEAAAFRNPDHPLHSVPFENFQSVLIAEKMLESHPLDQSWIDNPNTGIDFPLSIQPYSSADFIVHNIATLDLDDGRNAIAIGAREPVRGPISENKNEGFFPFQLVYTFDTSTNKTLSSSPTECWRIRVFPSGSTLEINTKP